MVERLDQPVRPKEVLRSELVQLVEIDPRILVEKRVKVVWRLLNDVDLVGKKRVDGLLVIVDSAPFHTLNSDHLAARKARGWLRARLVFVKLDIDDLLSRPPLILPEDKWAGADKFRNLLVRVGFRHTLRHHERNNASRLTERQEHEAGWLLEPQ